MQTWPKKPWSRLNIDHAGPVGGKIILIIMDAHSKWIDAHILFHRHHRQRLSTNYVQRFPPMASQKRLSLTMVQYSLQVSSRNRALVLSTISPLVKQTCGTGSSDGEGRGERLKAGGQTLQVSIQTPHWDCACGTLDGTSSTYTPWPSLSACLRERGYRGNREGRRGAVGALNRICLGTES